MVEVSKETKMETGEESTHRNKGQVKMAYPKNDKSLMEYIHCFQLKKFEVMICPRCSSVFDKEVVENIDRVRVASRRRN